MPNPFATHTMDDYVEHPTRPGCYVPRARAAIPAPAMIGRDYATLAAVVTPDMLPLDLTLGMALHTKGNADPLHRYAAARHNKAQRLGVYHALCRYGSAHLLTMPLTITITRIGPRLLGPTNPVLAAGKHVVDGIADWLVSKPGKGHYYDDDPRFTWHTQQEKGGKGHYAVHIRIEETPPCP